MNTKRVRAELELVFRVRGPFASAAPWSLSAFVDQRVHRVGGRPAVPGTEVLGLLRDGLAALGIADKVNALLGGESAGGGFDPVRRGLWVSPDFVAAAADTAATLAQTAIDKERGAAREGSLRVVELGARAGETTDLVGRLEWTCAESDAAATAEALVAAAAWIPCLGGHRSVGFGEVEGVFYRLTTVALTPAPTPAATPADAESRVLRLRLRDPFCFARPRRSEYMYESEEFVPGAALAGALATSWNELVGRPLGKLIAEDELIAEDAGSADLPKLRKYFTYLRFRHAMPAVVDDQGKAVRPTAVPLSRALIKKTEAAGGGRLVDMAAAQTNDGDDAVCYAPDWKGEERGILRTHHGWPRLERRSCVQHGHDSDKRRPADEQLFAYEVIEPDPGVVWIGEVDFRAVPDEHRAQVAAEFDALVAALGQRLGHLGKTKARADMQAEPGSIAAGQAVVGKGPWYVTLQTPALLGSPAALQYSNEPDPAKRLHAMYEAAWCDISRGALQLRADNGVFAGQSLVGGAYLRGRRGAAKPWLMTEAGSVFVLEAATEKAAEVLGNLLREGLPVDKHAAKFYKLENVAEQDLWKRFPCGRLVGFGEILVAAEVGAEIAVPAKPTAVGQESAVAKPTAPAQEPAAADAPAAPAVTGGEAAVAEIAAAAAPAQPWAKVAVAAAPSGELKAYPDPAPLRTRIEGTLTLRSPLRIGSGEPAAAEGEADIATVLRDADGRPWLPGSSIKGMLRAAFGHDARMLALLGTTAEGGKLRIGPARTTDSPDVCIERRVFAPHDRRRGAVAEHLLANLEVVREGTSFRVAFEGDLLTKDEVGALLKALAALGDDTHDLALGARSGGGRWGRVKWKHERSLVLTQAGSVRRPTGSWQGLSWRAASLEATKAIGKVRDAKVRDATVIMPAAGRRSVFGLELTFAGSLLVAGSGTAAKGEPDKRQETTQGGVACIPESATNVLRAQAERILRTLGIAACSPAAPCSPIHTLADVSKLCLTCRVFGAGGWKGPLQIGEFRAKPNTGASFVHEMHASDRFTGGVSANRKFTFAPVRRPVMQGNLSIDWARLPEGAHEQTVGLLALLLRDLAEGDVVFGARGAIGYGQVEKLVVTVARQADAAAGGAGLNVAAVECALAARWPAAGGPAFADEHAAILTKCLAALRPSTAAPKAQSAITIKQKKPANPGDAVQPAQAERFHNPYHFVPSGGANLGSLKADAVATAPQLGHDCYGAGLLSGSLTANTVATAPQLGHDCYGAGLLSGTLVCEVEAKSPLFVGNRQSKESGPDGPTTAQFYAPDGTPVLSGSSLRGMVGALIEAATDGPLRVLADTALSVRKAPGVGSVHEYFRAIDPELLPMHKGRETLGLAEQLLGYVSDDGAAEGGGGLPAAWRGRLRFSDAEATEEVKWATEREDALWTLQILGSPKPPSPAMYFRPAKGDGYVAKANMSTDNSWPRGRKAYLHHSGLAAVDPQSKTDKHGNQKLRVRPLAAGSTFRFEIRFDNLTQTELQLLCYALQPHGEFLHKLGLGKPLGMGSVKVAVAEILLCDRARRYGVDDVNAGRWHASGKRSDRGEWVSAANPAVPSPQDLAAGFRDWAIRQDNGCIRQDNGCIEPVLTAIEVVGDPRKLSAPVMYPRQYVETNGQWILQGEDRLFDWFADNDKKQPQERQHLGTVRDGGVPVLVHTRG